MLLHYLLISFIDHASYFVSTHSSDIKFCKALSLNTFALLKLAAKDFINAVVALTDILYF